MIAGVPEAFAARAMFNVDLWLIQEKKKKKKKKKELYLMTSTRTQLLGNLDIIVP